MPTSRPENGQQGEVLAFLGSARSHGLDTIPARIETHGAVIFLAGDHVYKIKRAITYPYLDFSTLAKRKAACEAEIEINSRNTPGIYLGVIPITRNGDALQLGGTGPVVEWAVHMRRFDETATLDLLADRHELTPRLIDELVMTVLDSHRRAAPRPSMDVVAGTAKIITQTVGELEARCDAGQQNAVSKLASLLHKVFRMNQAALLRRAAGGYVRRCHGDLHLRNIVMIEEKPALFDAIEFDEAIATIDILYDLAFLVMDLLHRGFRELACRLLNRYLWASRSERDDIAGLSLLPMYLALRAAIRAAVLGAQAAVTDHPGLSTEISAYVAEAISYLEPERPRVIAIGGLSGSGKSTISELLAPSVGSAPGAIQLRSDIARKKSLAADPTLRLGPDAYADEVSEAVYDLLCELGDLALRVGRSVIFDATFLKEKSRKRALQVATSNHVSFDGIWLKGTASLLESRLRSRVGDVSDATIAVLQSQLRMDVGKIDWHMIDASLPTAEILREIGKTDTPGKA